MRQLHNTTDWPFERIAPYGKDITAALNKLVERFPDDMTLEHLRDGMFSGKYQTWLVLDGERFMAFGLTEIRMNEATGNKTVIVIALSGEGGEDIVPLIEGVETWAREIGAHDVRPVGRLGWKKALAKIGYAPMTTYYRKAI